MAINLSLSKLPWYGQIGAFVALGMAGAAVFWNFYAQPAQASIEQRRAQLESVHVEVERGRAAARRLPQFRQEVATLEAQLAQLRVVLPEEQDVADLLRRVQGMATQSNLTIRGFTPHAVAKKQIHMEWPIGLKLEGRYHDLGSFLERVSKFPRIIHVSDIKIKGLPAASTAATVSAECTATTFVLIETPGGSAAPAVPAIPPPAPAPTPVATPARTAATE
jgi:type IV pilus assembly protein PilO